MCVLRGRRFRRELEWGDELGEVTAVVLAEVRKSDVKGNVYVDALFVDSTINTPNPRPREYRPRFPLCFQHHFRRRRTSFRRTRRRSLRTHGRRISSHSTILFRRRIKRTWHAQPLQDLTRSLYFRGHQLVV